MFVLVGNTVCGRTPAARLVALWACVLGMGFGALAGCSPPPEPTPPELIGVWRTAAPGYASRAFEIQASLVRFGTGEVSSQLFVLERVESLPPTKDQRRYRLHFRERDGAPATLDLALRPGSPPTLRLGDRPQEWVRRSAQENEDV